MERLELPELGKSFFIKNVEYKVSFKTEKSNKFNAEPVDEKSSKLPDDISPKINDKFMIDNQSYMVTYINYTVNKKEINVIKRITAIPLSGGY